MEQDVLVKAVSDQFAAAGGIIWSAFLVAVLGLMTVLRKGENLRILNVDIPREWAFRIYLAYFCISNILVCAVFVRISGLLELIVPGGDSQRKVVATILTQRSMFSPASYFGHTNLQVVSSSFGYALMVLVWWACFSCLAAMRSPKSETDKRYWENLYLIVVFAVGSLSAFAVILVQFKVASFAGQAYPCVNGENCAIYVDKAKTWTTIAGFLGVVVGVGIFRSVQRWVESRH